LLQWIPKNKEKLLAKAGELLMRRELLTNLLQRKLEQQEEKGGDEAIAEVEIDRAAINC